MTAPLAPDEPQRLAELLKLNVLDVALDPQLQSIAEIAAAVSHAPIALISLVDADRQLFKARVGLDVDQTCRDYAFCAYAILQRDPLIVEDAAEDPRFAANPLVTGPPHIRFYAGAPLVTREGHKLGTLCIIDTEPRQFDADLAATLQKLAALAVDLMESRKKLELAEAQLREGAQAGGVSQVQLATFGHELRTPLNHILGFSDLLRSNLARIKTKEFGRGLEYLDVIRQSASHLASLVEKIVSPETSVANSGFQIERLDLSKLLIEVARSFAGTVGSKQQRIDMEVLPAAFHVMADPTSLRQIIINLISNASKYSPAGADIRVSVEVDSTGSWCSLLIEDRGPGIPPAVLGRLGEPFVRGEGTKGQPGSGLGLYVTLRLCQSMGGALQIEHRQGGGTRVRVRLPAADTDREQKPRLVAG